MSPILLRGILFLVLGVFGVRGDTPANCTFGEVKGEWIFYETARNQSSNIDCSNMGTPVHKKKVTLEYPNTAVDEYDNTGTWTMIYNEGFEVRVGGRSYFAFSFYNQTDATATSYCGRTLNGWSRDLTIRNWACFKGSKVKPVEPKTHEIKVLENPERRYKSNRDFVAAINAAQNSWRAKVYPEYEEKTLRDMQRRAGARTLKSKIGRAKPSGLTLLRSMVLPTSFDWRNVSGVNYISPVRNQGNCGSCYGFASMAGLEARVRILTKNHQRPVFSVQDILECSHFSQACDGGFSYLTAGRYAQDFGVVLEDCAKYNPEHLSDHCTTDPSCLRHYSMYYRYVGGFYGACNEEEMKIALVKGGPLMVGFQVYGDFMSYSGGIYHHTGLADKFNPFEQTNHAVLLVGYGFDAKTNEKFWIVKNSWGESWGEEGFFRIRRGNDECGMESMAIEVVPIPA